MLPFAVEYNLYRCILDTPHFGVLSGTPHYILSISVVASVPSIQSIPIVFQALQAFKVNKDYLAIVIMSRVYLMLCMLLLLQNCTK